MEKEVCLHEKEFQDLKAKADTHISWTVFWAIMIMLVAIASTVFTQIFTRIAALESAQNESKVSSARIETQLSQIQTDILDIKLSLRGHTETVKK